jgi:hypothetical protein
MLVETIMEAIIAVILVEIIMPAGTKIQQETIMQE